MLDFHYETSLVLVSILVAILASYTALSLAERVGQSEGNAARWWIAGGAIAMGIGIWSMHFIGMLAFRLPIPVGYDLGMTLFSLMLPIAVSGLALWQVSRRKLQARQLLAGAILMGIGINTMHYSGMAAMRMQPGIVYDMWLVMASVVIAIVAAGGALWIAFALRRNVARTRMLKAAAAVVMGSAIVGMHYTGMAAASFPLGSICMAAPDGFTQDGLAILVIVATFAILTIALLASIIDARLASDARILAISQATAEERDVLLTRERSAREHAERMNILKDEFLATLSHELRTPLSAILGWSQILRGGTRDEATLIRGLETIERNARAQAKLIDDLLDMSKIISGKISLEVQQVSPAAFIDAAMETIRPAALVKQIRLEKTFTADARLVAGDANRLQQVMWNLLSNAVKFTPKGGSIRVVLEQAGPEVLIKVTDTGIGIEPAFLPHVFDRFRQADASTTRRYGGLGLGLSIAKQLVELHGGWIRAESEGENRGTTFVLGLPAPGSSAARPAGEPRVAHLPGGRLNRFKSFDLHGITVLVIDDEPDARELARQLLQECGARTLTAANARDGLSLVQSELPDVIVSDIGMPDMDGFELILRVRALGTRNGGNVPAIALSAFTRSEDRKQAFRLGFDAYLAKPIEPSDLLEKIFEITKKGQSAVS